MSDRTVIEGLLTRLNTLIAADDAACTFVERLLDERIAVAPQTLSHLSDHASPEGDPPEIGLLKLLNWVIAVQPDTWGEVVATYDGPGGKLLSLDVQE